MARTSHPRIFIRIPSYRDPECQWTVKDAFDKATYPERIFIGICWQYDPNDDAHCFEQPYPYPDQVRLIQYDAKDSKGCCWARAQIQDLWQGEEYTMQIDSHMRFEQGWDEMLITMLAQCDNDKAVLTSYPTGYTPGKPITHACVVALAADRFDVTEGVLFIRSCYFPQGYEPEKPIKGSFAAGGFMFSKSERYIEVPVDPHLYFFGEEVLLSARMYSYGWDMYHPNKPVIYHYYNRSERRNHYEDHHDWMDRDKQAFARIRHIFGIEVSHDPAITVDAEKYGFGTVRTLEAYQEYSGVDFTARTLSSKAKEGVFMDAFRDVDVSGMAVENQEWIATSLTTGSSEQSLIKQMLAMGFPQEHVHSAVHAIAQRLRDQGHTVLQDDVASAPPPRPAAKPLDFGMRRWIAGSLVAGCSVEQLHAILVGLGIDSAEAQRELAELSASPFLPESQELLSTVKKREWLLSMLDKQFQLGGKYSAAIERIKVPKFKTFLKNYYYENVPVVLEKAVKHWPAMKWTPELLKARVGNAKVQVQFGRESDKDYERNSATLRRTMRMADYIDLVRATEKSNDFYMTAGNWPESKHAFIDLYKDIRNIEDGYLHESGTMEQGFLWVGPAGTITPLHHDLSNNLFVQVYGRKRFILIPSTQIKDCYNNDYVYCDVDIFNIDYEKFPNLKNATILDFVLNPGEVLLIPNCWLHAVEAIDTSISLTFTNFNAENTLGGGYPGGRRY